MSFYKKSRSSRGKQLQLCGGDEKALATKAALREVGTLWTEKGIPWRFKRAVFVCKLQNTALSGAEAYVLTPADHVALDKDIVYLGRVALAGKACEQ